MKLVLMMSFLFCGTASAMVEDTESFEISASVPLYSDISIDELLEEDAQQLCEESGFETAIKTSRTSYYLFPQHYPTEVVGAAKFSCE